LIGDLVAAMCGSAICRFQGVILSLSDAGPVAKEWTTALLSCENDKGLVALSVGRTPQATWLSVVAVESGVYSNDTAAAVIVPVDIASNRRLPPTSLRGALHGALIRARKHALPTSTAPVLVLVVNCVAEPNAHFATEISSLLDLNVLRRGGNITDFRIVFVGLSESRWDFLKPQTALYAAMVWSISQLADRTGSRTGQVALADIAVSRANDAWMKTVHNSVSGSSTGFMACPYRATLAAINGSWVDLACIMDDESRRWAPEFDNERDYLLTLSGAVRVSLKLPQADIVSENNARLYIVHLACGVFSGGHRNIVDVTEEGIMSHTEFCQALGRLILPFVAKCLGTLGPREIDLPLPKLHKPARSRMISVGLAEINASSAKKRSSPSSTSEASSSSLHRIGCLFAEEELSHEPVVKRQKFTGNVVRESSREQLVSPVSRALSFSPIAPPVPRSWHQAVLTGAGRAEIEAHYDALNSAVEEAELYKRLADAWLERLVVQKYVR
jgi:hypothetical protein